MQQTGKLLSVFVVLVASLAVYFAATVRPVGSRVAGWRIDGGDPHRGREAVLRYGCGACHVIPGIRTATGRVGPKLEDLREQVYLAGLLPNTPENLVHWIRQPRQVDPRSAMPDLQVTEEDARDIAAYLYSR